VRDESLIAKAYQEGDYPGVVEEYEKILSRYPAHVKGADDLYYLGMSYYYLEKNALALKSLLEFQYRFHGDPRAPAVHLMSARVFRRLGKPDRALDALRQALYLAPDDAFRLDVWEEKADIFAGQGRYLDSLSVLDEAYRQSGPPERDQALARIGDLLRVMPVETIVRSVLPGSYSFPVEEGERVVEERTQRRWARDEGPLPPRDRELEGEALPLVKIGLLAPSTGRLESYGREVIRGTELLLENASGEDFPFQVEAVHIDEGAESDEELLLEEAIRSEDILVLIGPLLSSTVERVLPVAERHSLGVISPTASSPRLNGVSPNFFRNCLTLEKSGKALADLAVGVLGLKSFVIFTPDDTYGFHYADLFQREVTLRGGEVLALQAYDVELTDFARPIKVLKKKAGVPDLPAEGNVRKGEAGVGGEEYELPFDAVFLPGSAEEAGLILPQFSFHDMDVRRLAVFGGSGLNTPRFPEVGEEFAEGVIFTDGFFAGSPRPEIQLFVQRYRRKYGEDPGTFAAQAYDAAAIVLEALRSGADTREKMLSALGAVTEFPGVTGKTTLIPGGLLERDPFFGTVARGHLVSLELLPGEALSMPEPSPVEFPP
jgi:branched-chain amino acid transport system substrate-binding protein